MKFALVVVVTACLVGAASAASLKSSQKTTKGGGRCRAPSVSPKRVEAVITQCQDEVKLAIIQEALESLQETAQAVQVREVEAQEAKLRTKRQDIFNKDEKKIAGCLLQCVYRQVKAVDQLGFPEPEGLIKLYTEGGDDETYITATTRAVHACLAISSRLIADRYQEPGLACDVSYDVFECVTNKVAEYCGKV
ncbi:hypothetical protein B566_EDAN003852 [Ephemera danica]|nr:hypothetical protein B566_EDAN003852 [Ephemera danica]